MLIRVWSSFKKLNYGCIVLWGKGLFIKFIIGSKINLLLNKIYVFISFRTTLLRSGRKHDCLGETKVYVWGPETQWTANQLGDELAELMMINVAAFLYSFLEANRYLSSSRSY